MISVDLDSTLNTLIYDWIEYINEKEETPITISDITCFDEPILLKHIDYIDNPNLYDLLGLLEGAIEFIKELQKIDDVQIVSVTPDHHLDSKGKFVETHFPGVPLINVKDCKLAHTKNSWLIDDKLSNIVSHIESGNGEGIVFTNGDYIYNDQSEHVSMGDYGEIVEYIKKKQQEKA
mgnify:CR=1 FL=1